MYWKELISSGAICALDEDRVAIGWGNKTKHKEPPSGESTCFFFPSFFLEEETPCLTYENNLVIEKKILQQELEAHCRTKNQEIKWKPPGKASFKSAFEALQGKFQSGDLIKAVPYTFETAEQMMHEELFFHILRSLARYASSHLAYLYGCWDEQEGILGATPEMLFDLSERKLKTCALAGTATKDSPDLYTEKNVKEHQVVVTGILEDLRKFGEVQTGRLERLELGALSHLLTRIQVDLISNQIEFSTLVEALHPTPALGAFPRKEGKNWLLEYAAELPRKRFGAPAGVIYRPESKAVCYVSIRNLQWDNCRLYIGAGCGVVKQSQFEAEWDEICLKLKTIKGMLGL